MANENGEPKGPPYAQAKHVMIQHYGGGNVGRTRALVYGQIEGACRMRRGLCSRSKKNMAAEIGMTYDTFTRHVAVLEADRFIKDKTPKRHPKRLHEYDVTGKLDKLWADLKAENENVTVKLSRTSLSSSQERHGEALENVTVKHKHSSKQRVKQKGKQSRKESEIEAGSETLTKLWLHRASLAGKKRKFKGLLSRVDGRAADVFTNVDEMYESEGSHQHDDAFWVDHLIGRLEGMVSDG